MARPGVCGQTFQVNFCGIKGPGAESQPRAYFIPSCRHQLSPIARAAAANPQLEKRGGSAAAARDLLETFEYALSVAVELTDGRAKRFVTSSSGSPG